MGDEKLARICAEIYSRHQKALDLIFENKPDRASQLAEILRSWATQMTEKGELEVVLDKCNKTYTRFKTKTMSEILPDSVNTKSGWGTRNYYFYEIHNLDGGKEFYIQLSLSSKDIPADLREVCDNINKYHPSRQQKENWQWRIPFSTHHSKCDDELSEDKIFESLTKQFEKIKAFEAKLIEELGYDQA